MTTPKPPASLATVSAAVDRLASSRARCTQALDAARDARAAQPAGLLSLFTAWRAQPLVSLATGLWAAWARQRHARAIPSAATATDRPGAGLPVVQRDGGSDASGLVWRHPVLTLSGLALVLGWVGWRRFVSPRPSRPS